MPALKIDLKGFFRMHVKCQHCGIKNTDRNEMKFIEIKSKTSERVTKKYFHPECFDDYKKAMKEKEIEKSQLDSLYSTIKKILNVSALPHSAFIRLANARNGVNSVQENQGQKAGYTYAEIEEGFIRCEGEIVYALDRKDFDSFYNLFGYVMGIVVSELAQYSIEKRKAEDSQRMADYQSNLDDDYDDFLSQKNIRKKPKKASSSGRFFADDL